VLGLSSLRAANWRERAPNAPPDFSNRARINTSCRSILCSLTLAPAAQCEGQILP
jgi:hypothetical protein